MPESKISLTVITPVFNGEKYIENCLKNVAEQAFEGLEHLVMDGESSDGTVKIVQSWKEMYPHIRIISEKDNGQSDAMNKGIREAKGSIIGFLNVDDYYEPDILQRIPELFSDLPEPAFICGNLNIWNADGSLKHFNRPEKISLIELLSGKFEWPYNPSAYFYHKSLHNLVGFYNESNHYSMDYEFILEAARHTEFRHFDELWGNFCEVRESKTLIRFRDFHYEAVFESEQIRNKAAQKLSIKEIEKLKIIMDDGGKKSISEKQLSWFSKTFRRILG